MSQTLSFATAVIVAGGSGTRMGRPKQMLPLAGKPVLARAIEAFKQVAQVKQLVVVTTAENRALLESEFKDVTFVLPGATRLESVKNGVAAADERAEVIAVHDGARPLVDPAKVALCLQTAFEKGAALLAVPVKDTVKVCDGGVVKQTPDRNALWAAQTPQCYRADILKKALNEFGHLTQATDESQLVEKTGTAVHIVESDYKNLKITTPEDLAAAEALLGARYVQRTGLGFDLHQLVPGRKLFLGGAEIPHTKGFLGHSDGDLVLHAVCDAILGALCLGEIGILFPPEDESIKGISSVTITEKVLDIVRRQGAQIVHMDVTVVTQEPKIKPHYDTVRASLERIFGIGLENISFKSKSHEHVGEIGRGEAAMCHALVTLNVRSRV